MNVYPLAGVTLSVTDVPGLYVRSQLALEAYGGKVVQLVELPRSVVWESTIGPVISIVSIFAVGVSVPVLQDAATTAAITSNDELRMDLTAQTMRLSPGMV